MNLMGKGANLATIKIFTAQYGGCWQPVRPVLSSTLRRKSSLARPWSTPLAQAIADTIEVTGPIPIASYMRQCLTSSDGGYYTSRTPGRDQFGQKGDFITSPEISQIFGELLAIWMITEWMAQGQKRAGIELIEIGPGRGTLMDDMLRTIRNFKPFAASIERVRLVETSPSLREQQKILLCGDASTDATLKDSDSRTKHGNFPLSWHSDIRLLPNDPSKTPFIVAHEFFDALPIHAFKSVSQSSTNSQSIEGLSGPLVLSEILPDRSPQWRELLVTTSKPDQRRAASSSHANVPLDYSEAEFSLTLAKTSNPASLLLPESSTRYRALKAHPEAVIEISPEAQFYAADFARRIGGPLKKLHTSKTISGRGSQSSSIPLNPSGAALIVDYGPSDTIPTSTFRGIRGHKLVSPFCSAGKVDLSADVDFTALAETAVNASECVEVHGPIEQGEWLERMGIRERASALMNKLASNSSVSAEEVARAVQRLTERSGGGMGRLYKVLAIVPERGGKQPVGFGGSVIS